jgi:hypothetical protein
VKLLVTSAPWLLLVDTRDGSVVPLQNHRPEYYGVSWTYDGKSLCLGHSRIDNATLVTLEDYVDSERGGVSLAGREQFNCLSTPHQILCTENHLLATNTGRNCLTVFDQSNLHYVNHWFDGVCWDRKGRENCCGSHLNSVHLLNDRLYVLAHNWTRGSYVLEVSWPGLEVLRRIPTRLHQAHNVWALASGQIIVCDSTRGALVEITSGQVLWQSEVQGVFSRGLACHGQSVFVGKSLSVGSRKGRQIASGGIWVLDRDTWKEIDCIPLPRSGCVNEVRILDVSDECHHGRPFLGTLEPEPGVSDSYQELLRDFATTTIGDFVFAGHNWTVCEGLVSVRETGSLYVEEDHFTIATCTDFEGADVRISADIRIAPAGDVQHAGLVARYLGPGDKNMYVAMLYRDKTVCRADLWRNVEGVWTLMGYAWIGEVKGRLEFEVRGSLLSLALDGRTILMVRDDAQLPPGRVGVRGTTGVFSGFTAELIA